MRLSWSDYSTFSLVFDLITLLICFSAICSRRAHPGGYVYDRRERGGFNQRGVEVNIEYHILILAKLGAESYTPHRITAVTLIYSFVRQDILLMLVRK